MTSDTLLIAAGALPALKWQPIAPVLQIAAGGAILALLALFVYVRVFSSHPVAATFHLLLRLVSIAALVALLMGPSREVPRPDQSRKAKLAVLVDSSQSMLTGDCDDNSRIAFVSKEVLDQAQLQKLQTDFDLDLQAFDARPRPLIMQLLRDYPESIASGGETYLAKSVTSAMVQARFSEGDAMLVISDGRDSENASMQSTATLARSLKVPLYTVGVGGTASTIDAAVVAIPMQDFLIPDEPGGILVKVYQSGLESRNSVVRLKQGETVEAFPVRFDNTGMAELQLPVGQAEPGQYKYEISLDPLEGEAETSNNRQIVFCEVMKRRIRALILEGQPFWDSKFPAQSLRKDQRIELTQITQVSNAKRETIVSRVEDRSPKLPASREEWSEYDLVILGRGMENVLDSKTALQLVEFVREGGGHLIFCRGLPYDLETDTGRTLAEIMGVVEPVVWGTGELQELSLELTPSGRSSLWLSPVKLGVDASNAFDRLPGFDVMRNVEREKPGTIVLARAHTAAGPQDEGMPALVTMNYGSGRVAALLGEGHWKWSLLNPENEDLRGFYDTFWSNLVRWMVIGGDFEPGQQIALTLSRGTSRLGDPLTADVVFKNALPGQHEPTLDLTAPDGQTSSVPLDRMPGATPRYRATLIPKTVGVHQVVLHAPGMTPGELQKNVNVYDVNLERLHTSADMLSLKILAEHSGGSFFRAENIDDLHAELQHHRLSMLSPPRLTYIWDQGLVMACLLFWMGMEWIIRRWSGLW